MASLGSLAVNIVARTEKFTRGVTQTMAATDRLVGKVSGASKAVAGMTASLIGAGSAAAGVADAMRRIDSAAKFSTRLNVSVERLSELSHAARQAGIRANTLEMAMQRSFRRIAQAAQGSGEAVKALEQLGLSAQVMASLTPDQQLSRIADAMMRVETQGQRVALAMKLFDSEGVAMVQMLKDGSAGLQAAQGDARRLGGVIDKQMTVNVEKLTNAIGRVHTATQGFFNTMASQGGNAFADTIDQMADMVAEANRFNQIVEKWAKGRSIVNAVLDGTPSDAAKQSASKPKAPWNPLDTMKAMGFETTGGGLMGMLGMEATIQRTEANAKEMERIRAKAEKSFERRAERAVVSTFQLIEDNLGGAVAGLETTYATHRRRFLANSLMGRDALGNAMLVRTAKMAREAQDRAQRMDKDVEQAFPPDMQQTVAAMRRPELVARTAGTVDAYSAARRNTRDKMTSGIQKIAKNSDKQVKRLDTLASKLGKTQVISLGAPS